MWSVAECDAGLQSVRFVQVAVELAWLQDLLQAGLNAGLPRTPLSSSSAGCTVLGRCAQSLSGAAAATRRLSAGDFAPIANLWWSGDRVRQSRRKGGQACSLRVCWACFWPPAVRRALLCRFACTLEFQSKCGARSRRSPHTTPG
ncbi:hypothetical protein AB1Y20_007109 [Prymnesium parvum]|uniref:Uncharacterized protein n=1 Tax=Prymnesium parvum TaxID=97485 RepID=A0AB34J104_PRYPA